MKEVLFGVVTFAVVSLSTTAVSQDAPVNCMAYMSADKTFDLNYSEAMARAEATSAELVAPAKAAYDQAWEHARAVFDEAHAAYTIEIFESLGGKGDYAAETNARWISASNQASSLANKVATPAYEAASRAEKELNEARNRADRLRIEIAQPVRDTYEAAYYDAYVHPEPGWTADVAGYDRDIVLELAAAERERYCPPWRGRGFRLR
ncbi:MAG: hypothetical protein OXD31_12410 [Chloroflexi bacterium]|nr:hypothetical protein [Chloroflexota bacterium]